MKPGDICIWADARSRRLYPGLVTFVGELIPGHSGTFRSTGCSDLRCGYGNCTCLCGNYDLKSWVPIDWTRIYDKDDQ